MRHVLLIGPAGSGRSSMIERLINVLGRSVAGYITKKEDGLYSQEHGSPIYIYAPREERIQTQRNLVGHCKQHRFKTIEGAFDRHAAAIMKPVSSDHLIVFDEIGFMESDEQEFCDAILARLDGEIQVIAAVKDKDFPFLQKVKTHPKCQCLYPNSENWEQCFETALAILSENKRR